MSDEKVAQTRLVEAAAELIGRQGPAALTARKVATAAGSSTMAVYTHFGGMPALVRAVVAEGFDRLAAHMAAVGHSDDVVDDLFRLGMAYRANALENPDLYAVMFGTAGPAGLVLDDDLRGLGLGAFQLLVDGVQRVLDAGLIHPAPADKIAAQLWAALHGYVMLERSGYVDAADTDLVLVPLMIHLGVGLGMGS